MNEENKTQVEETEVKVEEKTETQVKEEEKKEATLPTIVVEKNWIDKIQEKNHAWRVSRAQKKLTKKQLTKAEKGARIGIGVGVGLAVLGGVAGCTLRHILNSSGESDYELDDDEIEDNSDDYFAHQLDGDAAEATEETV